MIFFCSFESGNAYFLAFVVMDQVIVNFVFQVHEITEFICDDLFADLEIIFDTLNIWKNCESATSGRFKQSVGKIIRIIESDA